jgi:phage shock protein PspC (stress-responsive transcriptional regulator)/predicted membrane protein
MTEHATTYKELRRSRDDRMIAGVSGGLGEYFDVNPVFYRVAFVVLTFLGGAGLLIYAACAVVIPNEGERESIASDILRNHRRRPVALVGLIHAAIAGIALLSHLSFRVHGDTFWVIVLVIGAVLLWTQRQTTTQTTVPQTQAGGGDTTVVPAAPRRRRRGLKITLFTFGALVLAAAVTCVVVAAMFARLGHGVGDRHYAPAHVSALRDSYQVGVGSLRLDLSRLELPSGTTRIHVEAGIGHVRVTVPPGVTVRAKTHVNWGDATLLGHEESGHDVHVDVGPEDGQLELDTRVGIGQIEVDRAVR